MPFIDADYDPDEWFRRARGMENEPNAAYAAPCVSTCDFNVPRYMRMSTVLKSSAAHWAFPAGKTWTKLMIAEFEPRALSGHSVLDL